MSVIEFYSVKDTAKVFDLGESRLRYWMQSGLLWPSVRKGGRFYYTFQDLVAVKAAKDLIEAGISVQRVRRALDSLKSKLPAERQAIARLRICSDGESLVVVDHDTAYEPESGQLVMAFAISSLQNQIAAILEHDPSREEISFVEDAPSAPVPLVRENSAHTLSERLRSQVPSDSSAPANAPSVPMLLNDSAYTEKVEISPYQAFSEGVSAHERGDADGAEIFYRRALEGDPTLVAALSNLGNIYYERGDLEMAQSFYEQALGIDPDHPEARFNIANIEEAAGKIEPAIANLRHVCTRSPDFADAHYNLARLLAKVGGYAQAREHMAKYEQLAV